MSIGDTLWSRIGWRGEEVFVFPGMFNIVTICLSL